MLTKQFIVTDYKIIHKIQKNKSIKKVPHVGSCSALSIHVLTCINICSHVTSYMIITNHTQIG